VLQKPEKFFVKSSPLAKIYRQLKLVSQIGRPHKGFVFYIIIRNNFIKASLQYASGLSIGRLGV